MKKLTVVFIVYLAYIQSVHAATTALTESLLEYEAITNFIGAPGFNIIGPDEFIIDIDRITRQVDILGVVKYGICTQLVTALDDNAEPENNNYRECDERDHNNKRQDAYIATLLVTPNPGIGPNIITVLSIARACN
jgi:hypothetical protein